MYTARTIAKWFIAWAEASDDELSNMKLQKLLYYAQGHYVALHHVPLFGDPIQAWSHGPVVPKVYRAYKGFGSSALELGDDDSFTWTDVDPETTDFLGKTWNTYGGFSAGRLRNMTHAESPWLKNWSDGDQGDTPIPLSDLEQHFGQFEAAV